MISRRSVVCGISLGILAAPLPVDAQPKPEKVPRIGLIRPGSRPDPNAEAFLQRLRELGYVENRTIAIEYRWADGKAERVVQFAQELAGLKVDLIVMSAWPGSSAAKRVPSTIPVVIPAVGDPVAEGLVASLARPGGNITGVSIVSPELSAKRLELLKETLPRVSRVAVLRTPTPTRATMQATEAAARVLGLHLQIFEVQRLQDLEAAFAAAKTARAEAVNIFAAGLFFANRARVVGAAEKTRLPAIYEDRAFVDVGGLLSYGPDLREVFRQAAVYVDKILKGARPADLPIEQPAKFELVINLKTARSLGLTIPQSLLLRADLVSD